uniref:Uncharacterized protein n=1 Tax=Knipowitschia caucasica TaxID=637954 RepID=A0AAV2JLR0_KNICA
MEHSAPPAPGLSPAFGPSWPWSVSCIRPLLPLLPLVCLLHSASPAPPAPGLSPAFGLSCPWSVSCIRPLLPLLPLVCLLHSASPAPGLSPAFGPSCPWSVSCIRPLLPLVRLLHSAPPAPGPSPAFGPSCWPLVSRMFRTAAEKPILQEEKHPAEEMRGLRAEWTERNSWSLTRVWRSAVLTDGCSNRPRLALISPELLHTGSLQLLSQTIH